MCGMDDGPAAAAAAGGFSGQGDTDDTFLLWFRTSSSPVRVLFAGLPNGVDFV